MKTNKIELSDPELMILLRALGSYKRELSANWQEAEGDERLKSAILDVIEELVDLREKLRDL